MKLQLAYYGNPILRQKAKEVPEITDEIRLLIEQMKDLLIETKGLGLAAPQVSHSLRIILIRPPVYSKEDDSWEEGDIVVLINPKLISYSEETWFHSEGCLSIPKLYADVERPVSIKIEATDINGHLVQENYKGWPAKVFLHEHDHLNGVLFIDRVFGRERKQMEPILRDIKKKFKS